MPLLGLTPLRLWISRDAFGTLAFPQEAASEHRQVDGHVTAYDHLSG